jgi:hypothetical protein
VICHSGSLRNYLNLPMHDVLDLRKLTEVWVVQVISKTVWPIAESLLQADYIVDGSGARRSFV